MGSNPRSSISSARSGFVRDLLRDDTVGPHIRKVAHAAQQRFAIRGVPARAARDLERARRVDVDIQDARRARDDFRKLRGV